MFVIVRLKNINMTRFQLGFRPYQITVFMLQMNTPGFIHTVLLSFTFLHTYPRLASIFAQNALTLHRKNRNRRLKRSEFNIKIQRSTISKEV